MPAASGIRTAARAAQDREHRRDQNRHRSKILGVVQPFIEPTRHGDRSERSRRSQQPQDNRHRATRAPLIPRCGHDSPRIPHRQVTPKQKRHTGEPVSSPDRRRECDITRRSLILSPKRRTHHDAERNNHSRAKPPGGDQRGRRVRPERHKVQWIVTRLPCGRQRHRGNGCNSDSGVSCSINEIDRRRRLERRNQGRSGRDGDVCTIILARRERLLIDRQLVKWRPERRRLWIRHVRIIHEPPAPQISGQPIWGADDIADRDASVWRPSATSELWRIAT